MEKESFESQQVADIMNRHFINIKVDREERPDVDKVYMTFVTVIDQAYSTIILLLIIMGWIFSEFM